MYISLYYRYIVLICTLGAFVCTIRGPFNTTENKQHVSNFPITYELVSPQYAQMNSYRTTDVCNLEAHISILIMFLYILQVSIIQD